MNKIIAKKELVKRVVKKLEGTKISIGGNKTFYKRLYNLKYSQEITDNVISALMDVIEETVENGDTIKLNGYMVIAPKYYPERYRRNVYAGKNVVVPEQYKVRISAGSKLKEAAKRLSNRELSEKDSD